jgi:arabinose-5-phosphate isomerase
MGSPAFFVHPGEAFHGDLGMITPSDAVVMISNSGETEELLRLIPFLQHQKNSVVAITGKTASTLAKNATVVLDIGVSKEACMLNLAPTSSTTATLVIGDAISVALSTARAFQPEDFARFHPGGSLGRKLLTRVKDVMKKDDLPFCEPDTTFIDILTVINRARLGLALVQEAGKLIGIVTDGDIRRALVAKLDVSTTKAREIMSKSPRTVLESDLLSTAEELMQDSKINSLVVLDDSACVSGVIQIYSI